MVLRLNVDSPSNAHSLLRQRLVFTGGIPEGARELHVAPPQPIYSSTIDAVVEKRLLAEAHLTGWQYMLVIGDDLAGVAEVSVSGPPPGEAEPSFQVLYPAAYAEFVNTAIAEAERLAGDYELRILRVPSIYLIAVWLVSEDEHLLLPIHPAPFALREKTVWREAELTNAIHDLAMNRRYTLDR